MNQDIYAAYSISLLQYTYIRMPCTERCKLCCSIVYCIACIFMYLSEVTTTQSSSLFLFVSDCPYNSTLLLVNESWNLRRQDDYYVKTTEFVQLLPSSTTLLGIGLSVTIRQLAARTFHLSSSPRTSAHVRCTVST